LLAYWRGLLVLWVSLGYVSVWSFLFKKACAL
jgi:hypothetical protein